MISGIEIERLTEINEPSPRPLSNKPNKNPTRFLRLRK